MMHLFYDPKWNDQEMFKVPLLRCHFLKCKHFFFLVWLDSEIGSEHDKNELSVSAVFSDEEMPEPKKAKNRTRNSSSVSNDSGIVEPEQEAERVPKKCNRGRKVGQCKHVISKSSRYNIFQKLEMQYNI